jgi:hypothetical protein
VGAGTPEDVCNGGLAWDSITASATAAVQTGYISTATSPITLTLPASPSAGDEVKLLVEGAGAVSVKLASTSTQAFEYDGDLAVPSAWDTESTLQSRAIASSADGTHLAASTESGAIFLSTDSGATWKMSSAAHDDLHSYGAIASSADGTVLVAGNDLGVFKSSDSGATWSQLPTGPIKNFSLACSSDCTQILAGTTQGIFLSRNGGSTWTDVVATPESWHVAMSADGSHLLVLSDNLGGFLSTNNGMSWSKVLTYTAGGDLAGAISADGNYLFAALGTNGVWVSLDGGRSWTNTLTNPVGGPSNYWLAVACSSDGTHVAAGATVGGGIYTSNDRGASWDEVFSATSSVFLASSADGTKLADASDDGLSINGTLSLVAEQASTLDLIWTGSTWIVDNVTGTVYAP